MATNESGQGQQQVAMWSMHADPRALNNEEAALNVPGTPGEAIFARGQSLLRELQVEGARLNDARTLLYQATRANSPTVRQQSGLVWNAPDAPTAEEHDLAVASQKLYAKVMGNANATADRIKSVEAQLESAVENSLQLGLAKTPEGISAAAIITDHVAGLADEKRIDFLAQRVAAGDKRTIAAVLSLPGYVSGLTDEAQATVRDFAASRFDPLAHQQREAVQHVRRRLKLAVDDFTALYEKIQKGFDPKRVDAARRAKLIGGVV